MGKRSSGHVNPRTSKKILGGTTIHSLPRNVSGAKAVTTRSRIALKRIYASSVSKKDTTKEIAHNASVLLVTKRVISHGNAQTRKKVIHWMSMIWNLTPLYWNLPRVVAPLINQPVKALINLNFLIWNFKKMTIFAWIFPWDLIVLEETLARSLIVQKRRKSLNGLLSKNTQS